MVGRSRRKFDGPSASVLVDSTAPFDFAGTADDRRAQPYDTGQLAKASHTITAVLWSNRNRTIRSANFRVGDQGGTTPDPTPSTTSAAPTPSTTTAAPSTTPTTAAPTTVAPTPPPPPQRRRSVADRSDDQLQLTDGDPEPDDVGSDRARGRAPCRPASAATPRC